MSRDGSGKVDFIVAGVQKAGTRALQHFLSQHPEIGLVSPPRIAPHFFDREEHFQGAPAYDEYHSWFSAESLAKTTGDITPSYSYWEPSIARIFEYDPNMKLVLLLRNPIERAYSAWSMEFNRGNESDPFVPALLKEPFRRRPHRQHLIFSYLHRGFYSRQVARLFSYYPREQCLVIDNRDLRDNHEAVLRRLFAFLGVSPDHVPAPAVVHEGAYAPMRPMVRRLLTAFFWRDIRRLEGLLGMDLRHWTRPRRVSETGKPDSKGARVPR